MAPVFADKIFFGGEILTMEAKSPTAEALAVKDENIVAVGALDEVFKLAGPDTELFYLKNQTLMPGFIEPHSHPFIAAGFRTFVNLSGYYYSSYSEVKSRMLQEIARVDMNADPLPWCVFCGWDAELIPDLPALDADFLDREFSGDVPIGIIAQNLHTAWVNHKAMQIAGIDDTVQDHTLAVYGRNNGKLTGQLWETAAMDSIIRARPQPTQEQLLDIINAQWLEYARAGLTTVADLAFYPDDVFAEVIAKEAKSASCPIRLAVYPIKSFKDYFGEKGTIVDPCGTLWEAGVKIFLDGSPHCGTSAVKDPYLSNGTTRALGFPPAPNRGILTYKTQDLYNLVRFYHDKGQQCAMHAHGERAIDQALEVLEKVLNESDDCSNKLRHRLEHLGLGTEEQMAKAGKLNIALSFFVDHLYYYAKSYSENIFGPERTNRWAPLSLATKHGVTWTIHQDQPGYPSPSCPFENMKTAITRTTRGDDTRVYGEEYRVSIDEVLKAYTIHAAWQLHRETELGSLAVNKKADLVVLSHNPYRVEPRYLESIRVLDTFINGRSNNLTVTTSTVMDGQDGRTAIVYAN